MIFVCRYVHPDADLKPLTGLKSFPAVICVPFDEGVPLDLMASIFMLATDESAKLSAGEMVVFDENRFKHTKKKHVFYLATLNKELVLAIVYAVKKGVDRTINTMTKRFVAEMRSSLGNIWRGLG